MGTCNAKELLFVNMPSLIEWTVTILEYFSFVSLAPRGLGAFLSQAKL